MTSPADGSASKPATVPGKSKRRSAFELAIEVPAVIVTIVMMLHITANAILRAFLGRPIDNTLEIVQFWYMPVVAFLGFIAAQYRGQHIAADLIFERLPRVAQRYVGSLVWLVCAVLALGFAWFTWKAATHAYVINQKAGLTDLPAWPTYFLAPLAFGALTIQFGWATVIALVRPPAEHVITDPDDVLLFEELEEIEHKQAEKAPVKEERR